MRGQHMLELEHHVRSHLEYLQYVALGVPARQAYKGAALCLHFDGESLNASKGRGNRNAVTAILAEANRGTHAWDGFCDNKSIEVEIGYETGNNSRRPICDGNLPIALHLKVNKHSRGAHRVNCASTQRSDNSESNPATAN